MRFQSLIGDIFLISETSFISCNSLTFLHIKNYDFFFSCVTQESGEGTASNVDGLLIAVFFFFFHCCVLRNHSWWGSHVVLVIKPGAMCKAARYSISKA